MGTAPASPSGPSNDRPETTANVGAISTKPPSGMRDVLAPDVARRRHVVGVIQRVYESQGGTGTPLELGSDSAATVDAFRAGMLVSAALAFAGAIVAVAWISNREARGEEITESAPATAAGS